MNVVGPAPGGRYTNANIRPAKRAEPPNEQERTMADTEDLAELEQRIEVLRDNLRQLVEQAAGYSGAEDEERNADRIAQQQSELDALIAKRDALAKK